MTPAMFDTILIANRGEIACRIIATCRRMDIRTVAVYSDADAQSRHVRLADTAVRIGPPPAAESYLLIDRILRAARETGAQAIHPGYGFLAENDAFAEACLQAGVVFIGPTPGSMRAMGSKAAAKALMRNAGVPLTQGYDGTNQDAEILAEQAASIGYPVMIKANAGGGGKGMRRVDAPEQFAAALAACQREAKAAFGDDSVLLEKYLVRPRHIEVQVFGDSFGNVISLFERDCSVQRRHQKVIEEAPAPGITAELRDALSKAACSAARAVKYVGAGTVEFLVDAVGGFHFMEMNTRLQVEHPVTEMITGLDLVEWQFRVAAGEPLPLTQQQLAMRGHAIEARIYAEDPAHDFLPSIGKLVHLKAPATSAHLRVETGVEQGDTITPFYDPMIAKLVVWGETREIAVRRMTQVLSAYQIAGVANNVGFLRHLIASRSFVEAKLDTSLIEREQFTPQTHAEDNGNTLVLAALSVLLRERGAEIESSPWTRRDGWRLNSRYRRTLRFEQAGDEIPVVVEYSDSTYTIATAGKSHVVSGSLGEDGAMHAVVDDRNLHGTVVWDLEKVHVFADGSEFIYALDDPLAWRAGHHAKESSLIAPMPGRVIAQAVQPGEHVEKGAALLVLEAMKMECTIHAPDAGRVEIFHFGVGDQVSEGVELLSFERDNGDGNGDADADS